MAQQIEDLSWSSACNAGQGLFGAAEAEVRRAVPGFRLHVFEDRDVQRRPAEVEAAIALAHAQWHAADRLSETAGGSCHGEAPRPAGGLLVRELPGDAARWAYAMSKGGDVCTSRPERRPPAGRQPREDALYGYHRAEDHLKAGELPAGQAAERLSQLDQ